MTDATISITGLDKAVVLKALFDKAIPPGARPPDPIRLEDARRYLAVIGEHGGRLDIGWLHGRQIHVDLSGDEVDGGLYDKANGAGAAKVAIDAIRSAGK